MSRNPRGVALDEGLLKAIEDIRSELQRGLPNPAGVPRDSDAMRALLALHAHVETLNRLVGELVNRTRHPRADEEGRGILRRLMASLDLSFDDLGRMLAVSGETVRRWERGLAAIPARRQAPLTAAGAALDRLLAIVRPERLPATVRRPAEAFGGETALDWILRGRIQDVADEYERMVLYHG
jgi:DNA-binding transcriptional regulator YiaG